MSSEMLYVDANVEIRRDYIKADGNIWDIADVAGFEGKYDTIFKYVILIPIAVIGAWSALGAAWAAATHFPELAIFVGILAALFLGLAKYFAKDQELYLINASGVKLKLKHPMPYHQISMLKYALETAKLPDSHVGRIWNGVAGGEPLVANSLPRLKRAFKADLRQTMRAI
jgi:hypothetical protein